MPTPNPTDKIVFRAFLSHSYRASAANRYFFELFSEQSDILFDVDQGTKATNVTRLERFIRDADAFVGIYALAGFSPNATITREQALEHSRYFRLELDIAYRTGIPGIVFVDERFGNAVVVPPSMTECRFSPADVEGVHRSPSRDAHAHHIRLFIQSVEAMKQYRAVRTHFLGNRNRVGVLLSPAASSSDGYRPELFEIVERLIHTHLQEAIRLPWPPRLDARFYSDIRSLDWLVVDVGGSDVSSVVVSFLHGFGVPMMRLSRLKQASPMESLLFGAYEVGYPKDIVRWTGPADFEEEFRKRLTTLHERRRAIGSTEAARDYFYQAELRKEAVFISYSGADRDFVSRVSAAFKTKFQRVFDYKDGESIVPGKPWMQEIFDSISKSAIGILMVSPSYLASGNCQHEAREMVARRDVGQMKLIPVKLADDVKSPVYLNDTQYINARREGDADSVVKKLLWAIDQAT